jgi:hypothetical protein
MEKRKKSFTSARSLTTFPDKAGDWMIWLAQTILHVRTTIRKWNLGIYKLQQIALENRLS